MKSSLVIAIDGPSASGKGTLAKKIAQHFKISYLNTGAIYRLIALRIMSQKIDPNNFDSNIPTITQNISESDLEREELFGEDVGAVASVIAKNKKLRAAVFDFQKDFIVKGKNLQGGCVLEGRDTTTVIAPDADFKFFITCDVEIRAKRRFAQLQTSFEEILLQLKKRDENDMNRADSPLEIAKDAYVIDNGKLSIEEGFQKIIQIIST